MLPATLRSVRSFSTSVRAAASDISFANLKVQKAAPEARKTKPANKDLVFGASFSDHMLEVPWNKQSGWAAPIISPYHRLSIDPASNVLHYGIECFEGMKAYKDKHNQIRLFRPDKNMARLKSSCERIALPSFNTNEFLNCIKELVKLDADWIPKEKGYSLYIRPTAIGTQESLGVGASNSSLLFVINSPVGPYYKTGFAPVKLLADTNNVRAWPGGTGGYKLGLNYAPTILPQLKAMEDGCQQVLWLFGPELEITEVGTMNFFMFWKNQNGETELVTPPLKDIILPGVTRDSILSLARSWGEFKVSERNFTIHDVVRGIKEKRVIELFGAGTAAIVSPIGCIKFEGQDYPIPLELGGSGKLTKRFFDTMMSIQYGELEHEWSVIVK
ncbi:branched-chain-amino-acid aminotransferase [Capsaspora owczarzaki ATCC 30864]|uniref:Branched-chain-amino-acid aminotransferase n=1 Tax=Capsaspora owczarzaki (strain ATCC 30864) TaxID=595528 RepID=A0A0D2WST7_CAPO3|nr:branched-chain-amino-acid aminotransferase [Capsaspora owczarzaki ATCC 30864]KJE95375.1 branched-chain-amino-acid aminotransferase [Capsaspora owczarzaki ATCC 30864]|eukprot:XP_004345418.1 branched-chain-amino-acid aminotransferase [Capsaspora owczarzaki ATCC 30864]